MIIKAAGLLPRGRASRSAYRTSDAIEAVNLAMKQKSLWRRRNRIVIEETCEGRNARSSHSWIASSIYIMENVAGSQAGG